MLAETITKLKTIYSEKKDVIEWMEKNGNEFQKTEAAIIKKVALDF